MKPNLDYDGVIVQGNNVNDPQGKYLVFIPELNTNQQHQIKPFWATNEVNGNVLSRWTNPESNMVSSSGSYFPLREGMNVNVRFRTESVNSAYINRIKTNSPMLLEPVLRDEQYLINKTIRGSYILQDDSVGETHISNLNGKTNIIMDDSRILLKVTEGMTQAGVVSDGGFEVEKNGMTYNIGNVTFRVDLSGITMNVGDNILSITESGVNFFTKKLNLEANDNLYIKSNNIKITGSETLQLFSNDLKATGNTNLNLVGHNVKMEADPLGSVHINGAYISVESLINTSIKGSNVEVIALANFYANSPIMNLTSMMGTISSTTLALDSSTMLMDGTILSNIGAAKSLAVSGTATNTVLSASLYAAYMGISMGTSTTDPISGSINSILVSTVPGSSSPIGNMIKPFNLSRSVGSDIQQKLGRIQTSDNNYKESVTKVVTERLEHGFTV